MENNVTITLQEYKTLLLMAAQSAIIKDYVRKGRYISVEDLKIILDIEETEGESVG